MLPGESVAEYGRLCRGLIADLQPQGKLEEILCERIAATTWRLRRLESIESAVLANAMTEHGEDVGAAFVRLELGGDVMSRLARIELALRQNLSALQRDLYERQQARGGGSGPHTWEMRVQVIEPTHGRLIVAPPEDADS